ncbi:hypothetical protein F4811DRAFT_502200 [Daldinia bambusicola]|nr:hypothetical protein F4811DRAFT_502200 [Daldinia bambusicola]
MVAVKIGTVLMLWTFITPSQGYLIYRNALRGLKRVPKALGGHGMIYPRFSPLIVSYYVRYVPFIFLFLQPPATSQPKLKLCQVNLLLLLLFFFFFFFFFFLLHISPPVVQQQ